MRIIIKHIITFVITLLAVSVCGGVMTPYDQMPGEYYRHCYDSGNEETYEDVQTEEYPESFDLRSFGIVSDVRNQGETSTCWAISAMESLETQINKASQNRNVLLSPWHLAYFTYTEEQLSDPSEGSQFNCGGFSSNTISTLSKWQGPVYESTVPFGSEKIVDEQLRHNHDYCVQNAYNVHQYVRNNIYYSQEEIKKLVYDKNAVSVYYYANNEYYNEDTAAHYCPEKTVPTHAVLIVGWDDNYSMDKFITKPSQKGAWLIKDSYGTEKGKDGYIWISYDDASLCEAACYFAENKDIYDNNYYYDDYGWIASISTDAMQSSLTGYMSNIFTANSQENISAVSFYTSEPGTAYDIKIYKNITDENNPVSGKPAGYYSGTQEYMGYHTVDLENKIPVEAGEKFSVVVKIVNRTSPYTVPVEAGVMYTRSGNYYIENRLSNQPELQSKRSFISNNGSLWRKISGESYRYFKSRYTYFGMNDDTDEIQEMELGAVCIKAFTENQQG
ncbi:MAG: lectin like domain-containing protein [Oscillospiraceae bacterium]|nr:lectin like domain-containing protein [Oscillospiraceae bacterium]